MFRKENGVTLVALVITIIVLLILAGVTISMVLGDNGILGQAKDATVQNELGDVKEKVGIAAATLTTQYLAVTNDETTTNDSSILVNGANLAVETQKLFEGATCTSIGNTTIKVQLANGNKYTVDITINDTTKMITVGAAAATN